jgi:hypothetical protein
VTPVPQLATTGVEVSPRSHPAAKEQGRADVACQVIDTVDTHFKPLFLDLIGIL